MVRGRSVRRSGDMASFVCLKVCPLVSVGYRGAGRAKVTRLQQPPIAEREESLVIAKHHVSNTLIPSMSSVPVIAV